MIQEKSCGCIIIEGSKVLLIKHNKGHWDFPKGHVEENETEIETAIREVKEETNLDVLPNEEKRYTVEYLTDKGNMKQVVYFLAKKIGGEIKPQESEISQIKWLDFEEAEEKITYVTSKELWRKVLNQIKDNEEMQNIEDNKITNPYNFIGKIVRVKIDRKLGSKHPKHDFIYPVNYGYVPNTISGDKEELDCYILGIEEPIEEFEGKCIAVIHRTNDNDDKLIIAPKGRKFTDDEIRKLTHFQEQYFKSKIIR